MTEVQAQPPSETLTALEDSPELDEFLNWSPASSDVAGMLEDAKQLIDDIHRLSNEHKFEELLLACSKVSLLPVSYFVFLMLGSNFIIDIMAECDIPIYVRCQSKYREKKKCSGHTVTCISAHRHA